MYQIEIEVAGHVFRHMADRQCAAHTIFNDARRRMQAQIPNSAPLRRVSLWKMGEFKSIKPRRVATQEFQQPLEYEDKALNA